MNAGRLRRIGVATVLAPFVLAACGSSGGGGAETTPAPNTTPWRTLAPAAPADTSGGVEIEGGVINYKVRSGDYPAKIAKNAGGECTGTELLEFNPEISTEQFVPGIIMKIPANCLGEGVTEESLNAGETASDDDTDSSDSDASDEDATDEEPVYNEYVVVKGDYPFKIVEKTGCSYDELKKANGRKFTDPKPKAKLKVPVDCDTREGGDEDSSD